MSIYTYALYYAFIVLGAFKKILTPGSIIKEKLYLLTIHNKNKKMNIMHSKAIHHKQVLGF